MNCEKCGNPKSKILLFSSEDWICKPCENATVPYTYKIEYSEVPYGNTWRTLLECWRNAGRNYPFEIEVLSDSEVCNRKNTNFYDPDDFTIVSYSKNGWVTKSNSHWPRNAEKRYRLYKGEK